MRILDQLSRTVLLCRDYVPDKTTDDEISERFERCRVLCVSDLQTLSSHSGQTALVTLVSLLSRMGMQVNLRMPEVRMILPQPLLSGVDLRQALIDRSEKFMDGATIRGEVNWKADVVFVLGDSQIHGHHPFLWWLSASDWSGALTMSRTAESWTARWPIGAIVSAALAAAEAFKFVMRSLQTPQSCRELFEPTKSCSWDFGSVPLPEKPIDLGRVDIISAGAISQAALYTLAHIPHLRMHGRIFDYDFTAETNLNRNMLTLTTDVGLPKVQVASESCRGTIELEPVPARFSRSNATGLAERVLVGVDDIPSRWEVQGHAPGWVGVAGTSHFSASSSAHGPGQPCSGCLHPLDDPVEVGAIPTVSFVSLWAGLATAVRLLREALDKPYSPDCQHLWLTPLRIDQPHAAWWLPVRPRIDCPVNCVAARHARVQSAVYPTPLDQRVSKEFDPSHVSS
jgi:hypothetical protein